MTLPFASQVVDLIDAQAMNSTCIRLEWQMHVIASEKYVEGLHIRYRQVNGDSQKFSIATVYTPSLRMHQVTGLNKFTEYEFFVTPFYKSLEGQPSKSRIVRTLEDGK